MSRAPQRTDAHCLSLKIFSRPFAFSTDEKVHWFIREYSNNHNWRAPHPCAYGRPQNSRVIDLARYHTRDRNGWSNIDKLQLYILVVKEPFLLRYDEREKTCGGAGVGKKDFFSKSGREPRCRHAGNQKSRQDPARPSPNKFRGKSHSDHTRIVTQRTAHSLLLFWVRPIFLYSG